MRSGTLLKLRNLRIPSCDCWHRNSKRERGLWSEDTFAKKKKKLGNKITLSIKVYGNYLKHFFIVCLEVRDCVSISTLPVLTLKP